MRIWFVFVIAGLALTGCSLLSKDEGERLPAGAFRGTAILQNNTVPLPVEVADDIASIKEDGQVEPKKEVPPEPPKPVAKEEEPKSEPVEMHPLNARKKFSRRGRGRSPACDCPPYGRRPSGGKTQKYAVRPGDTLMKIAFTKYGDILRWRDIYEANREILADFNKIEIGSVLVIHNVEFVVIEKNGEPYLIRRGDTLGKISTKLYGSREYWRDLWKNNRQLIRNPNRIYAGFKIYYLPASELKREPTTEAK